MTNFVTIEKNKVKERLHYPLIDRYVGLSEDSTVEEGVRKWREMAPDARIAHYLYIIDSRNRLRGTLALRELLAADPKTLVKEIMEKDIPYAHIDEGVEQIASIAIKNHVCAIPIVDQDQKLLGIASVDDVLDAVRIESDQCVYRLVGLLGLKPKPLWINWKDALVMAKARLPWLLISLIIGVFICGGIVRTFEEALVAIPVIAAFIPVLMASGGNISTQGSTILVRTLTLGQVKTRLTALRLFVFDLTTGIIIGLILGVSIFTLAILWIGDFMLAITLFLCMLMLSITATGIGFFVPYISYITKIDPALTSGPLVTLIKDVTGLLIYFIMVSVIYLR